VAAIYQFMKILSYLINPTHGLIPRCEFILRRGLPRSASFWRPYAPCLDSSLGL